jgi:alkanesulfonate monooxygenase
VLPLRNPVLLAKQLSSMDLLTNGRLVLGMASGWYKREFDSVGVPFEKRGKIMDESLTVMNRLWTEPLVAWDSPPYNMKAGVMFPKPHQRPRPPILIGGYVDRVLKRAAVAADGWLTYFYTPESFTKSWKKVCDFAAEAGKDPATLMNANQLPIMVGKSRAEVEAPMTEWLSKEWDYASWSESTKASAIMGTVDECVAQLKAHLSVGVQKIIFVPYQYRPDQVDAIAKEIIPRLRR